MLLAVLNGPDTFVGDEGTCLGSSMRMVSSVILGLSVVDFVSPITNRYIACSYYILNAYKILRKSKINCYVIK